jgi:hypothetical protein
MSNEYMIIIRVDTEWHEPYNTTTSNTYTEFQTANSAKEAVRKELSDWNFSNPNKSVHLVKVTKL